MAADEQDGTTLEDNLDEALDENDGGEDEGSDESRPTGNAFDSFREKMGDVLRGSVPTDDDSTADDDEDDDPGEGDEEEDDDDEEDEESDKSKAADAPKKPNGDEEDEDDEPAPRRYTMTDENGDEIEAAFDKGTVLRFKGDGREIAVDSFDGLVQLAQKGAAFDRVSSRSGQLESELRTTKESSAKALEDAEELLLKAVFDPETREKLEKALEPFKSPDVRAAAKVNAREAERQEREKGEATAGQQAAIAGFWDGVKGEFEKSLAKDAGRAEDARRFAFVTAEDHGDVVKIFHGRYTEKLEQLAAHYAAQPGVTEEQAIARAQKEAAGTMLTEKALRQAMATLNEKYAKRAGSKRPAKADSEREGKKAAAAHNTRTTSKLERRDKSRTLRAGGAPPANRGSAPAKAAPRTFAEKMAAIGAKMNEAKG